MPDMDKIISQTRVPHAGAKNWRKRTPCPYSASSPPPFPLSQEPCFLTDRNF